MKKYRVLDRDFSDGKIISAGTLEMSFGKQSWLFPSVRSTVHRRSSRRSQRWLSARRGAVAIWSDAPVTIQPHRTRIPRTCVNRSTAPHFNRPMHIRPSLAALNEPSEGAHRATEERAASIATRCSSLTHPPPLLPHPPRVGRNVPHFFEIKAELEFASHNA